MAPRMRNVFVDVGSFVDPSVVLGHPGADNERALRQENWTRNRRVLVGRNCVVLSGAVLYEGVRLANNCRVGHFAVIREDCRIGDGCVVGHGAVLEEAVVLCDRVIVGAQSHIGARAELGEGAVAAPGARVPPASTVPPGSQVEGVFSSAKGAHSRRARAAEHAGGSE